MKNKPSNQCFIRINCQCAEAIDSTYRRLVVNLLTDYFSTPVGVCAVVVVVVVNVMICYDGMFMNYVTSAELTVCIV